MFEVQTKGRIDGLMINLIMSLNNQSVPEIRKHRYLEIKAAVSNSQKVNHVIWSQLQIHTSPEYDNVRVATRSEPWLFKKSGKSVWSVLPDECREKAPHLVELVEELKTYQPVETRKKNYVFTTFHQSFSYEDFVEGIKPLVEDDSAAMDGEQSDIRYVIEKGIFYNAVDEACRLAGFLGVTGHDYSPPRVTKIPQAGSLVFPTLGH